MDNELADFIFRSGQLAQKMQDYNRAAEEYLEMVKKSETEKADQTSRKENQTVGIGSPEIENRV